MKTPALRNTIEMSELHQRFDAISHARRYSLAVGDSAKVCVVFGEAEGITGERFWVDITAAQAGCYQGMVANELSHSASHGLSFGDLISFDYRHIYEAVLQSEFADMTRKAFEEMAKPDFKNENLKPYDQNQP